MRFEQGLVEIAGLLFLCVDVDIERRVNKKKAFDLGQPGNPLKGRPCGLPLCWLDSRCSETFPIWILDFSDPCSKTTFPF